MPKTYDADESIQVPSQTQSSRKFYDADVSSTPLTGKGLQTFQPRVNPQSSDVAASALNTAFGHFLPMVGGGLGELFGGPAGAAFGTGAGQAVEGPITQGRGFQPGDIQDAVTAALTSAGISSLTRLPGLAKSGLAARRISKAQNVLEQGRQEITGGVATPPDVESQQNVLKARLQPVKAEANAAWDKVRANATDNTQTVQVKTGDIPNPALQPGGAANPRNMGIPPTVPQLEPRDIEGAIPISQRTLQYIQETKQELQTKLLATRNPKLGDAYGTLTKVERAITTDHNTGVSYLPFDAAKQLRTDLGKAYTQEAAQNLAPGKQLGVSFGTASGVGLREQLGMDIEKGIGNWKNGNDALLDYANATGVSKTVFKTSVLDKLIARNTNAADGTLNVPNILNQLKNEVSKEGTVFNAAERNRLTQVFQAVRNVSPAYPSTGKFMGQNFVLGGLSEVSGHPIMAVRFMTRSVLGRLLENPSLAKIMQELPSAPANTGAGRLRSLAFLKGMGKGIPAALITPDGKSLPAHTDSDGNLIPDYQSSR